MQIGLVIERMETWRGGAETSTAQFARELLSRGHAVRLFTTSRGVSEPGVQVITVDAPTTRARRAGAFSAGVTAALAEHPCDVVHSMTALHGGDVFMPRGGTVAETIEANLRVRRSGFARDIKRLANLFNRRQQAMLRLERRLLGGANAPRRVIALSRYVADQLSRHYQLGGQQVIEVFNGVQVPRLTQEEVQTTRAQVRQEWGLPEDSFVMLFVAHNFKLKGLAQLIDGVGLLNQRHHKLDWHLLVVGRDQPGSSVARADRWGVGGRIIFTGPSERTWRFYLAADLFVLPTFYDPCSRVVLESVCLGTPAVTTRYNGAAEVLTRNGPAAPAGAAIANPHDVEELLAAIEPFIEPDHRRQASASGLALRDFLSMSRHAEEMLAIYRQHADEKSAGA